VRRFGVQALLPVVFCVLTACAQPKVAARHLDKYRLSGEPVALAAIEDDLSGVAVDPKSGNLLVIENGGCRIFEITPDGKVARTVTLAGFEDTEDLATLPDGRLAVVEERRRMLVVFPLAPEQTIVDYKTVRSWLVDPQPAGNLGLEGVAHDPATDRFFIVKEKGPRRLYELRLPNGRDGEPEASTPWDIEAAGAGLDDLSAIFFDTLTGRLLILSDESKCLVEFALDGTEISRLSLKRGSAGLVETILQPEGAAMGPDGTLYIVSEPNMLYVFRPE
jgi:uncharacterized protein YjiK